MTDYGTIDLSTTEPVTTMQAFRTANTVETAKNSLKPPVGKLSIKRTSEYRNNDLSTLLTDEPPTQNVQSKLDSGAHTPALSMPSRASPIRFENKNVIFAKDEDGRYYSVSNLTLGKPQVPQQYLRIMADMRTRTQKGMRINGETDPERRGRQSEQINGDQVKLA
jgi:hypothetical protein